MKVFCFRRISQPLLAQGMGHLRRTLVVLVLAINICTVAWAAEPQDATIAIDFSKKLQRIDGFGSGAFGGFTLFERGYCDAEFPKGVTYHTTPEQRKAMITTAVRDLGVTHLRMWLCPAGIELTNDNDDPNVIDWDAFTFDGNSGQPLSDNPWENRRYGLNEWADFLVPAVEQGLVNWIVTPGWLPQWLKKMFDDKSPDRFEEYAEWAVVHLLYLKEKLGLEAPWWSMMNEPDVQKYKSAEMWIPWIQATGQRFRKEGLETMIVAPDYMNVYEAVPLTEKILADDGTRQYIGAIAYHHYRSSFDDPKPFLDVTARPDTADAGKPYEKLTAGARAMAALGRKYNLPSWQTETAYYPKPLKEKMLSPWDIARGRANEIYYELTSGASAVAGMLTLWVDAIDPRYDFTVRYSGQHIVMTTDGTNVTDWAVTKDCGGMFAHYARFVRPGDQRIEAACPDRMLRVTAFATKTDQRCVAVVINNANARRLVRFELQHLSFEPRFAGGLLSDERRAMVAVPIKQTPDRSQEFTTTIPPSSVCTFVWSPEPYVQMALPAEAKFK